MKSKFLLFSAEQTDSWVKILELALAPLGTLEITTQEKFDLSIKGSGFAVVIIDATVVNDPVPLIVELLAQDPEAKVVVATSSPTWRRANEVIKAGAMDYITKTMVKEELHNKIETVMRIHTKGSKKA